MTTRKPSLAKARRPAPPAPESSMQLSEELTAAQRSEMIEVSTRYLVHMARMSVARCELTLSEKHELLGRIGEEVLSKSDKHTERQAPSAPIHSHRQQRTG